MEGVGPKVRKLLAALASDAAVGSNGKENKSLREFIDFTMGLHHGGSSQAIIRQAIVDTRAAIATARADPLCPGGDDEAVAEWVLNKKDKP